MIHGVNGAHVLIYSENAEVDRAFLRDVLGFRFVEVGRGWLIFALPPAELAVHPAEGPPTLSHSNRPLLGTVLYLMCDDLHGVLKALEAHQVKHSPVHQQAWGLATSIELPSGGELGLYQPSHATALNLQ
jgi:hypothetical protein